jgi:hypothetical protein
VTEAEKALGDLANCDDRAGQPIEDQISATTVTAIGGTWRFNGIRKPGQFFTPI